jgi:DNA-binding transcriptional regulator LsrR (DeoR family)
MIDERHQELLAQVASLYYEAEKSQNAIADELGLSRVKVYRLLKEAREESVVKILIDWPIGRDSQLEKDIAQVFHLKKALVLKSDMLEETSALRRLGQMTARYLDLILEDGMTLTVCLGRSTYEVINAMTPTYRAHINVAQAMGSIPFAVQELDSPALARQLAHKLGGKVLYLPSPLIATSLEASTVIRNQPLIERTLNASRNADISLVGIGGLDPSSSRYVQAEVIQAEEMIRLKETGAAGDLGGQFFTLNGELHPCELNQRMIGLSLEEMKRIPNTIAVALGKKKSLSILGALRTGVIDVFCTDNSTAREVLGLNETF